MIKPSNPNENREKPRRGKPDRIVLVLNEPLNERSIDYCLLPKKYRDLLP